MFRPKLNPFISYNFMALFLLTPLLSLMYILKTNSIILVEAQILSFSPSQPSISIIFDSISLIFILTVSLISFSVLKFSDSYMATEPFLHRFTSLVILFVISMNFLILIPNMITLLLGWDGLGLVSFLLVIYYQNPKSLSAGMITFLTNRLGDALIITSILWSFDQANWNIMFMVSTPSSLYIPLFVMLAAITKSAQIPFSSWLPAAMAAPTPVSALVHSSTLVTAGVYLLIRFFPMLSSSHLATNLLLLLSCLTTLMAGLAALFETDMKKIIALSTLSQLGMMMMSTALHAPQFTFFHLITHAMFKALLFICAGTLIHAHMNNQDLRMFGNMNFSMPLTSMTMSIANMALCGLPYMAGFYSKDMIIELAMSSTSNLLIMVLTLISTALTAAYSFRISIFTIWSPSLSLPMISKSDNNASDYTSPMLLMTSGAIFSGALMNWIFVSPSFQDPLPLSLKISALSVTLLGSLFLILKTPSLKISLVFPSHTAKDFLMNMWYLTPISTKMISKPSSFLSMAFTKVNDHGWNELLGPQGLNYSLMKLSNTTSILSNLTLTSNIFMIIFITMTFFLL